MSGSGQQSGRRGRLLTIASAIGVTLLAALLVGGLAVIASATGARAPVSRQVAAAPLTTSTTSAPAPAAEPAAPTEGNGTSGAGSSGSGSSGPSSSGAANIVPSGGGCGQLGDAVVSQILQRTNADRAANGLGALAWNEQLSCLALDWSTQLGNSNGFYHRDLNAVITSPGYSGYHTLGENILRATGGYTAAQMEQAWMDSPGHRANILSGAYTSIGIGIYYIGGQVYATQNFGG